MPKLRVAAFSVSIDGFGAGPRQSIDNPLGSGGTALHSWAFTTRTFQQMHGGGGGDTGPDEDFARRSFDNVGAWILGRNMFGPLRGPWPDEAWKGWWGDNPPVGGGVETIRAYLSAGLAMSVKRTGYRLAPTSRFNSPASIPRRKAMPASWSSPTLPTLKYVLAGCAR